FSRDWSSDVCSSDLGSIAAYKAPELVRRLKDAGATVRVVMTDGAAHFITPTALQAVSGEPVRRDLWDEAAEAAMGHIELARWAEIGRASWRERRNIE